MKNYAKIKNVKQSISKVEELSREDSANTNGGLVLEPIMKGIIILCYGILIPKMNELL